MVSLRRAPPPKRIRTTFGPRKGGFPPDSSRSASAPGTVPPAASKPPPARTHFRNARRGRAECGGEGQGGRYFMRSIFCARAPPSARESARSHDHNTHSSPSMIQKNRARGRSAETPYLFSVAQIANLPYRRLQIGRALAMFRRPGQGVLQDGILRYRLAVCATNTTEALQIASSSSAWFFYGIAQTVDPAEAELRAPSGAEPYLLGDRQRPVENCETDDFRLGVVRAVFDAFGREEEGARRVNRAAFLPFTGADISRFIGQA